MIRRTYPPEEPVALELEGELAAAPPLIAAVQVNDVPPKLSVAPLPVAWPGLSCTNVYRGLPPKVTCPLVTPSFAWTAESDELGWPPEGAISGGQMLVHWPVHATLEPLSWLLV